MKWLTGLFILVVVGVAPTNALVIPYSGGKLADSIKVRTVSIHELLGTQSTLAGTTIQLGNVFSLKFQWKAKDTLEGLCSFKDAEHNKIFLQVSAAGEVRQLSDSGTNWNAHSIRPADSVLIPLASLPVSSDTGVPIGYRFALEGVCEGTNQSVAGNWNRILFIRNGSQHAKISIVANQDTVKCCLPSFRYLKSITLRYVVNDSNELSDPVSLRPAVKRQPDFRSGRYGNIDLYNLLGVRLKREARPQEVVIPLRR
jgi:hypothetical protein